jgi:hypothetical protein
MSAVLDVSRPTPLRLFGFLFTAVGGLLIALGAISDWATVVFLGGAFPDSAAKGIDVPEGKVALGLGIFMLVAIVAMRLARWLGARRTIALLLTVSALAALAIGVVDVVRAQDRFGGYTVDQTAKQIAKDSGQPLEKVRADVQGVIDRSASIDLGLGIWLVVAGGVIGTIGGLLDLAWVGQRRLAALNADIAAAD